MTMELFAGIDLGSTTTKMVAVDENRKILFEDCFPTAGDILRAKTKALARCMESLKVQRDDFAAIIATGYGRKKVDYADGDVTEITCHALGAHHMLPDVRTVIDIGGQDSKAIHLTGNGAVADFVMNDKCAAGTGRYLEMLARTFDVSLDELGRMALQSTKAIRISSICTVFAETEVISLVAEGVPREDILNAAHLAICEKIGGQAKRVGVRPPVALTGGVSRNVAIVTHLEGTVGCPVVVPDKAQMIGALGAALSGLLES